MRGRFLITVALATAALAFGPAAAYPASDPATAVQEDLAVLTSNVQSAQSILLPDLVNLRTDLAAHNNAAVKRDVQKLRTDLKSILPRLQKVRKQLASDVSAAHAVG